MNFRITSRDRIVATALVIITLAVAGIGVALFFVHREVDHLGRTVHHVAAEIPPLQVEVPALKADIADLNVKANDLLAKVQANVALDLPALNALTDKFGQVVAAIRDAPSLVAQASAAVVEQFRQALAEADSRLQALKDALAPLNNLNKPVAVDVQVHILNNFVPDAVTAVNQLIALANALLGGGR